MAGSGLAAEELPGVPVSLSCVVLPELREYERALTTVANGYVQPQVATGRSGLLVDEQHVGEGAADVYPRR